MHKKESTKSLGSTASNSNSSTLDQQRPLITEQTTATEQPTVKRRSNLLNSAAKRLRMLGINGYSMGVNGNKPDADSTLSFSSDRCCCRCLKITTSAYLIAFIEIVVIVYHLFLAIWNYDKYGDDYAFSFILGVFCMGLALVAVILMVIGIWKSSPYFLVPHLLMQFATIVSWTLLAGYLILLMIGGTSVKLEAVVYEDSDKGRLGLANINKQEQLGAQVDARGLNIVLVLLLGFTVVLIGVQIWFFTIIRRCFVHLRQKAIDKPNTSSSSRLPNDQRV